MKTKKIDINKLAELENIKLPNEKWSLLRAEIEFKREGYLEEFATVVYDSRNATFYVKTNKAIVYPGDEPALKEALELMHKANKIINSEPK